LELAAQIARPFESCSLTAYHDPVGFATIGWGHLLSRNAWEPLDRYPPITQGFADALLEEDMDKALRAVLRLVKVPVSEEQAAALADFAFNLGGGALQMSTLLHMVNRGDLADAAEQFARWNKAGGRVLKGLTRRRLAERSLFLSTTEQ
jgi:lysozyme